MYHPSPSERRETARTKVISFALLIALGVSAPIGYAFMRSLLGPAPRQVSPAAIEAVDQMHASCVESSSADCESAYLTRALCIEIECTFEDYYQRLEAAGIALPPLFSDT